MAATAPRAARPDVFTIVKDAWVPDRIRHMLDTYAPKTELGHFIRSLFPYLPATAAAELLERVSKTMVLESALYGTMLRGGMVVDYGLLSRKVITTAGVGFLVDAWQNSVELEIMKYHAIGIGTAAEATGDTALGTELGTQYNPDNTRATGSLTEGASANIFRTVGTNTVDATVAITEHGLFSVATAATGVLWDRSVFSAINMISGDSLQTTYDMTASVGG